MHHIHPLLVDFVGEHDRELEEYVSVPAAV